MSYDVRGELLGFPDTHTVTITEIDSLFSRLQDTQNDNITFTIVNPYALREYSFEIPVDIKILLNITEKSSLSVYNILILQKPIENSYINFLAPIVINNDNKKLAQVVLEPRKYPDFGMTETIHSFKEQS
ncbi:flagellar assembly protein FliW [Sulfurimonas sp. SAG-AH-194-L11]|nr:flagellar assembly protein FliW [Sulfurimonas sp. SAG-AH-194-L11]MDF1876361.1 flagellar assembly protein FliW [Sulfurimonas sp. SAG-AH-194-L11]